MAVNGRFPALRSSRILNTLWCGARESAISDSSQRDFEQVLKNTFTLIFLTILASGCYFPDHSGFYMPITLSSTVPDGPPEYKAGWYAGCKTGSSVKSFTNGGALQTKNGPDFGSGVYTHDPVYQTGWGQGYTVCTNYVGEFVGRNSMQFHPLQ